MRIITSANADIAAKKSLLNRLDAKMNNQAWLSSLSEEERSSLIQERRRLRRELQSQMEDPIRIHKQKNSTPAGVFTGGQGR